MNPRATIYLNTLDAEIFAEKLAEARHGRANAVSFLQQVLAHLADEGRPS